LPVPEFPNLVIALIRRSSRPACIRIRESGRPGCKSSATGRHLRESGWFPDSPPSAEGAPASALPGHRQLRHGAGDRCTVPAQALQSGPHRGASSCAPRFSSTHNMSSRR